MSKSIKKLSMEEFEAMIQERVNAILSEREEKEEQSIELEIEEEDSGVVTATVEDNTTDIADLEELKSKIAKLEEENAKWKALFDKKETTTVKPEPQKRSGWGK